MAGRPRRRAAGRRRGEARDEREPPTPAQAWDRVLGWLGRAPRSRLEIERRLRRWTVAPDDAAAIVERLKGLGLIDDEALAGMISRDLDRRGVVGAAARAKLRARGIGAELAGESVRQTGPDEELERAVQVAERRLRALPADQAAAERRLRAYLLRRGFSSVSAREATRRILETRQAAERGNSDTEGA